MFVLGLSLPEWERRGVIVNHKSHIINGWLPCVSNQRHFPSPLSTFHRAKAAESLQTVTASSDWWWLGFKPSSTILVLLMSVYTSLVEERKLTWLLTKEMRIALNVIQKGNNKSVVPERGNAIGNHSDARNVLFIRFLRFFFFSVSIHWNVSTFCRF